MLRVEKGEQPIVEETKAANPMEQRAETVKTLFRNLLPLTDFGQTIQHTEACVQCLTINTALLARRVQAHGVKRELEKNSKFNSNEMRLVEKEIKNINEDLEVSNAQYNLMVREAELNRHKKILEDQRFHFDNTYRNTIYAEFKRCRANAVSCWAEALETVAKESHGNDVKMFIAKDIKAEVEGFKGTYPQFVELFTKQAALDATDGLADTTAIETVNTTFKSLERLLAAYKK